jgi:hypothetical protein
LHLPPDPTQALPYVVNIPTVDVSSKPNWIPPNLSPVKPGSFNAQIPLPRPKVPPDVELSAQLGGLSLDLGIDDEETYFD